MQRTIVLIVMVSLIAVITVPLSSCSNSQSSTIVTNSVVTTLSSTPGIFILSDLTINPAEVNAGVQVLIAAKVTNTGSLDENYQGNVRLDSLTQQSLPSFLPSGVVKITAGETQLLSVITTVNKSGTYKVTWDNTSQTLVVNPAEIVPYDPQTSTPIIFKASDFSALDVVTGIQVSLSQYKGSVILLNFVNYGCNPYTNQVVGAQLQAIRQLQAKRSDFIPFSVFCGCCPPEVLRQFAKENNFNWPWVLDSDYSIVHKWTDALQRFGYPTLVFINKNMTITEVTGSIDLADLTQKIDNTIRNERKN